MTRNWAVRLTSTVTTTLTFSGSEHSRKHSYSHPWTASWKSPLKCCSCVLQLRSTCLTSIVSKERMTRWVRSSLFMPHQLSWTAAAPSTRWVRVSSWPSKRTQSKAFRTRWQIAPRYPNSRVGLGCLYTMCAPMMRRWGVWMAGQVG